MGDINVLNKILIENLKKKTWGKQRWTWSFI